MTGKVGRVKKVNWNKGNFRKWVWGLVGASIGLQIVGCSTPQFLTVTIYDSPHQVVRLQTISEAIDGKGMNHPAYISEEKMAAVMRGLYVEISTGALPLLEDLSPPRRSRAFSDTEIKFFAPLFVKGLAQATPEEIVTFLETAEISDTQEITTSGGIFLEGDVLYLLISNYSAKTQIWQDADQYQAPNRLRPLEPISPQPGRLVVEPAHLMVDVKHSFLQSVLKAEPWQVGIRYKGLK